MPYQEDREFEDTADDVHACLPVGRRCDILPVPLRPITRSLATDATSRTFSLNMLTASSISAAELIAIFSSMDLLRASLIQAMFVCLSNRCGQFGWWVACALRDRMGDR